ncbi:MAG: hypothetical protein O2884_06740 [Chloroflexi bacterium]|nr:hypothetical protein [Chloroflexota bacterium]
MDNEVLAVLITLGGGALLGGASYLVRSLHGWWTQRRKERGELVASLHRIAAHLRTSKSLVDVQFDLRDRLYDSMQGLLPGEAGNLGFEAAFTLMHEQFTNEQKDLHGMVRAITVNGLRPVNQAVSEWLDQDTIFKTGMAPLKSPDAFASWLRQLELHLTLWHAKYRYWIPDARHALVYLADEEDHGVRFPSGIIGDLPLRPTRPLC